MKTKIFKNIIPVIKIYHCLFCVRPIQMQVRKEKKKGNIKKEQELIKKASIEWGNRLLDIFGVKTNVKGKENLPKEGPVVFVANHQSYADIPILSATLDTVQMGYVAKKDMVYIPFYTQWIKDTRSIFIVRNHPREALKTINEGIDLINQGFSLLIFPEGTRSRGPNMREFKKGALKLATKAGVPVVPVTISGSYKCFEQNGYFKGEEVDVIIHPPIPTSELSKAEQGELANTVESKIRSSLEQIS